MKEVDRILNGENIREVLRDKISYGIDVVEEDAVFEMSKLSKKYAKKSITGDIPDFIYFSPVLDSHGPRIKFYGGSKETSSTRNAPSYEFGVNGPIQIKLQSWMDKSNCPNAFDPNCIEMIESFIKSHLALLLLTWFNKLDEADVLEYFLGHLSFKELVKQIDIVGFDKDKIFYCKTEKELYAVCKELDLYKF